MASGKVITVMCAARLPEILVKRIDAASASGGVSRAQFIAEACRMQLDGVSVPGAESGKVDIGPKSSDATRDNLQGGNVTEQDKGLAGSNPAAVPSQALREICAGKITKEGWGFELPTGATITSSEVSICDIVMPICIVCDSPMREVKGKWACADMSCGKYGVEQKPRW